MRISGVAIGLAALLAIGLFFASSHDDKRARAVAGASAFNNSAPPTAPSASQATPTRPETTQAALPTPATVAAAVTARLHPLAHGRARTILWSLHVKGRAPMAGYQRDRFGPAWADNTTANLGQNRCGTRDDILAAQLRHVHRSGCAVTRGDEIDPYTGKSLRYLRGHSSIDVDHVVALRDAWQTGAQQLPVELRTRFANDPLNLIAVSRMAKRQKRDSDAASWLPSRKSFRCAYVARQVAVKARYGLWVTPAERDAIIRVLTACPREVVPTGAIGRAAPARPIRAHRDAYQDAVDKALDLAQDNGSQTGSGSGTSVYYANCDAARAAGAAPLHRGDPGYDSHLDRDGDGVACE